MSDNRKQYVIRIKRKTEKIRLVTVFAFLVVVCLPFHTIEIGGVGLLMLLSLPLLVLSLPALLARFQKTTWDRTTVVLACFFGYNIFGYLWTPSLSFYSIYNYVKIVAIVICLYCQAYSRREKDFLLAGSVISCLIICWFMLTGNNTGYVSNRMTVAVFGVAQDPNYLGYLFIVPMAVSVTQILNHKMLYARILYALLATVILLCVMITGSRGALLGLAAVVAICILKRFKGIGAKMLFCAVMGLLIFFLYDFILTLLPEHIAARFSLRVVMESRGTHRMDIWMNAFRVMSESPYKLLFGFGTGSSHYLLRGWAAHNLIIQLLLELGIVGTTLFLAFLWTWIKRLAARDTMCLSILMGCMAMAMTLSVNTIYYFWLAFILGIVCSKARSGSAGG